MLARAFMGIVLLACSTSAFIRPLRHKWLCRSPRIDPTTPSTLLFLVPTSPSPPEDGGAVEGEEMTKKFGLEVGLFKSAQSGNFDQVRPN